MIMMTVISLLNRLRLVERKKNGKKKCISCLIVEANLVDCADTKLQRLNKEVDNPLPTAAHLCVSLAMERIILKRISTAIIETTFQQIA